jgi:hypothetical protein
MVRDSKPSTPFVGRPDFIGAQFNVPEFPTPGCNELIHDPVHATRDNEWRIFQYDNGLVPQRVGANVDDPKYLEEKTRPFAIESRFYTAIGNADILTWKPCGDDERQRDARECAAEHDFVDELDVGYDGSTVQVSVVHVVFEYGSARRIDFAVEDRNCGFA